MQKPLLEYAEKERGEKMTNWKESFLQELKDVSLKKHIKRNP